MSAKPDVIHDVVVFYNKNNTRAQNIYEKLCKLKKQDGEPLKAVSYDDMQLGVSKIEARIDLTETAHAICLIVTDEFLDDSWNNYEAIISVNEMIESKQPKLMYVQIYEKKVVLKVFKGYTYFRVSNESNIDIATKIKEFSEAQKNSATNVSVVNIDVPENLTRVTMMINIAVTALAAHFEINTKMKKLHTKMSGEIANRQNNKTIKENWIDEISKAEYWTDGSQTNLRNIKNIEDVDQLTNALGYLTLSSGFLGKKQSEPSDEKGIQEYLDNDRILHLLKTCSVFEIIPDNLKKIVEILNIRNELAHHKSVQDEQKEEQWKNQAAKTVLDSLYGILGREEYLDCDKRISQALDVKITATITEQDKHLKKELQIVKDEVTTTAKLGRVMSEL